MSEDQAKLELAETLKSALQQIDGILLCALAMAERSNEVPEAITGAIWGAEVIAQKHLSR